MAAPSSFYRISTVLNQQKELLQEAIKDFLLEKFPVLDMIEKNGFIKRQQIRYMDDKYVIPFEDGYPASARGVGEGEALPPGSSYTDARMTFTKKKTVVRNYITWEQVTEGQGSQATLEDSVTRLKRHMMKDIKNAFNTQLEGYSVNGAVAKIYATDSDDGTYTTCTVYVHGASGANAGANQPGTRWLRKGQPVIVTDSDGYSNPTYGVVYSVTDYDTVVITGTSLAAADTNLLVLGDSNSSQYGKCITGLSQHFRSDGPTTYQGVTRASYPFLKANVLSNSGTNRSLDSRLIADAVMEPAIVYGEDATYDFAQINPQLIVEYADLFDAQRQFRATEALQTWDPRQAKMVNKVNWLVDNYMPGGQIRFGDSSSFVMHYSSDFFQFEDFGGKGILAFVGSSADYDIYEARARTYCQLACTKPNANTVLADITQTPRTVIL